MRTKRNSILRKENPIITLIYKKTKVEEDSLDDLIIASRFRTSIKDFNFIKPFKA